MNKFPVVSVITACVLIAVILAAGCTSEKTPVPASKGDALYAQGENEIRNNNLNAAETLFGLAQENYTAEGNTAAALKARDRDTVTLMKLVPFPWNRSAAEQQLAETFPNLSVQERTALLDATKVTTITTDGEVMYSLDTVNNIWFHNPPLMQKRTAAMNYTPLYDQIILLVRTPKTAGAGPYGEPVRYTGLGEISIPREELPKTGTFKLWMPLPVDIGSQTNVTIISVEPARYVKSSTGTGADIGLVYLEVPLEEFNDPFLNVTTRFSFIQHEQRFTIDPVKVKPYNTNDPEYLKYTKASNNIALTPEMKMKAQEIVGNETNPYLQAQKIYWSIVDTFPYSHAPHSWINAMKIPESTYMLTTDIGDCGTQSVYFAALCRSLGIPARAPGGYQMIEGKAGTHFWAEYYLEGYGWIPVDVTAAEGADWSHNATADDRHRYKEYFFGSLDPYRYIIQKDADVPLVPPINDPTTVDMAVQEPRAMCDTCTEDTKVWLSNYGKLTVTKE
ncbi:MAG: transglutaminase-like domain-containing protein [Methanoregula sp.]